MVTLKDFFAFIRKRMNDVLELVNTNASKAREQGMDGDGTTQQAPVVDSKAAAEAKTEQVYKKKKKKKKDDEESKKSNRTSKKCGAPGSGAGADDEEMEEEQSSAWKRKVNQTPCIYLPNDSLAAQNQYLDQAICYKCGPPCAPERPYILEILPNSVNIQWFNPPFDGIAPTKYKIYMKNITRNFHEWEEVHYPGDIMKTKFLVRNLPIGVACQFKVAAFNNGGWGKPSDPTSFVTPGEEQAEITQEMRWYRVRQGGVLAVLDQMSQYKNNREEQLIGLKILLGIGSCHCGFKSTKFGLLVAQKCFDVSQIFDFDPEIMSLVFHTLTWCLHGKSERKVRQLCMANHLDQLVGHHVDKFRHHSGVVNAIQGLRQGTMHKYLPKVTEYKYKVLFPKNLDDEASTDEEEDGEEKDEESGESEKKPLGLTSVSI